LCRLSCRAYVEFVPREGAHHKTFVHDVKENSLLQGSSSHTLCVKMPLGANESPLLACPNWLGVAKEREYSKSVVVETGDREVVSRSYPHSSRILLVVLCSQASGVISKWKEVGLPWHWCLLSQ
jgi:hypothetical protein